MALEDQRVARSRPALHTRAVLSSDAVTMRLPSGLHAAHKTQSLWPSRTMGSPEPSAFHTRAVLSSDAVTMRLPSGLHAAELTSPSWPLRVIRCSCHRRSKPARSCRRTQSRCARRRGLHAADLTNAPWPLRTIGSPVPSAFHTRAVLSSDAVTMRLPSGLHAAESTAILVTQRRSFGIPLRQNGCHRELVPPGDAFLVGRSFTSSEHHRRRTAPAALPQSSQARSTFGVPPGHITCSDSAQTTSKIIGQPPPAGCAVAPSLLPRSPRRSRFRSPHWPAASSPPPLARNLPLEHFLRQPIMPQLEIPRAPGAPPRAVPPLAPDGRAPRSASWPRSACRASFSVSSFRCPSASMRCSSSSLRAPSCNPPSPSTVASRYRFKIASASAPRAARSPSCGARSSHSARHTICPNAVCTSAASVFFCSGTRTLPGSAPGSRPRPSAAPALPQPPSGTSPSPFRPPRAAPRGSRVRTTSGRSRVQSRKRLEVSPRGGRAPGARPGDARWVAPIQDLGVALSSPPQGRVPHEELLDLIHVDQDGPVAAPLPRSSASAERIEKSSLPSGKTPSSEASVRHRVHEPGQGALRRGARRRPAPRAGRQSFPVSDHARLHQRRLLVLAPERPKRVGRRAGEDWRWRASSRRRLGRRSARGPRRDTAAVLGMEMQRGPSPERPASARRAASRTSDGAGSGRLARFRASSARTRLSTKQLQGTPAERRGRRRR